MFTKPDIHVHMCSECGFIVCMRWELYFSFRSLRTSWQLSLGLPLGYVGLRVAYVQIRRHHVFRLGSLIGIRSVARFCERDVWGPRGKIGELSYSN